MGGELGGQLSQVRSEKRPTTTLLRGRVQSVLV